VRLSNQNGTLADTAVHHNKRGGILMSHRWRGDFTVARAAIHANDGGALKAYAMNLTILDSVFRDNRGGEGAALYLNQFASAAITGTVFIADVMGSTGGGGGAIYNRGGLVLTNSTVAATPALGEPLLVNLGRAELRSVTLAGPLANGGSLTAGNTILGGCTTSPAVPISAPPVSLGHNLDAGVTCALTGAGDRSGVDPRLGLLGDNGGWTWTRALLGGSPAIDAGDPALCTMAYDQRGAIPGGGSYARSRDGDGDGAAVCDIGAFEVQAAPAVTPTPVTPTPVTPTPVTPTPVTPTPVTPTPVTPTPVTPTPVTPTPVTPTPVTPTPETPTPVTPTVTPTPETPTPETPTVTPTPETPTPETPTETPTPETPTPETPTPETPTPETPTPVTPTPETPTVTLTPETPTVTPTVQPQNQTPAVTEAPRVQFRLFIPAIRRGGS
jgi:hypothetical protein